MQGKTTVLSLFILCNKNSNYYQLIKSSPMRINATSCSYIYYRGDNKEACENSEDGVVRTISWIAADKKQFDVFILGGDHMVSLKKMVETMEEVIGKKAKLKMLPMQLGDVDRTCADLTNANSILGFKPSTEFKEGIVKFADWFNKVNDKNNLSDSIFN